MFMLLKSFIVASLLFFTIPALAEYYQFTDQNGNVNFTDDISIIPEDQRKETLVFESVQQDHLYKDSESQNETESVDKENSTTEIPGISTETDLQVAAAELEKMNTDLENASSALNTEREAVLKLKPEEGASSEEMVSYREAIEALNAKIEQYEKQRQAYEEEVQAYNKRVKAHNAMGQNPGE